MVLIGVFCVWLVFCIAEDANSANVIYTFNDSVGLGRQFDGIGGLSGGGATSKLLVNYPEKQRSEILDFLFKPNFGASLQILKVEIGGDAQSTDGTEASHMHNSWDENYQRGYEWWLMTEAKKRNPNIKLYGLPWAFPGWIGNGTNSPYHNPTLTATYIMKWIQGAKTHYNLIIDFVGIWNERPYNITYIKTLRKVLDMNGLTHVRIVAPDGGWGIADDILKDAVLADAVDYIGAHYPGTNTDSSALKTGKQLWASEDYSTFNNNVGGGCWTRILNQNYVNGFMTSTISWNLIASYYNPLPFFRDGLMTAVEPWSGNYIVESPIWLSAHTTQFTQIGWKYLKHGAGVGKLESGGSYVGLVSPDGKDITIVIETMSHDHSLCIRPALPKYKVKPSNITVQLSRSFAAVTQLNVWYSKLGFGSEQTTLFSKQKPLMFKNGMASLSLNIDEVYTLTTLSVGQKGSFPDPPPSKPFPLPYSESFDEYDEHMEPGNLAQQMGSFEVINVGPPHNSVMRQMVVAPPVSWCKAEQTGSSLNIIGNYNWSDIYVESDMKLGDVNGTDGVFLASRINKGGCEAFSTEGIFLFIFPAIDTFLVANDLARTQVFTSGKLGQPLNSTDWMKVSLLLEGNRAIGTFNGKKLFNSTVPKTPTNGFVGMGTDSWGIADFDNVVIHDVHHGYKRLRELSRFSDNKLYFVPGRH